MGWKITDISEADFGCEERLPGEKLKVCVKLENENGETKTIEAYDEYLTWNHIDVGSDWTEPTEEKKALFFKITSGNSRQFNYRDESANSFTFEHKFGIMFL